MYLNNFSLKITKTKLFYSFAEYTCVTLFLLYILDYKIILKPCNGILSKINQVIPEGVKMLNHRSGFFMETQIGIK